MALSGSFNTTGYEGRYLTLAWSVTNSQADRIENNRSVISWTLKGAGAGQVDWYRAGAFKVVIAGKTVYSSADRIQLYNGTQVASGSVTINHKSDGTQGFTASAEAGIYTTAVNCKGSGTFTLDYIPRTSSLTVGNGTVGAVLPLSITRGSSTFKHRIQYWCGSLTGYVAGSASTFSTAVSFSWTVPREFAAQNPNGSTVQVKFVLGTYTSAGTLVGYTNKTITCAIPSTGDYYVPKCSFTLDDITKVDEIYGSPVQGLSQIKAVVTATPAAGSTIKSCVIDFNGTKYSGLTATTGILPYSGDAPVVVTVTDSRGRMASANYTMKVQAYQKPRVPVLTVQRCDQDGTQNPNGGYIKAYFEAAVTSLSSKNTASYTLRYRKYSPTGSNTFTEVDFSDLVNKYTASKTYIFAADATNSYDVEVEVADAHGSAVRSTTAPTAFALFNVGEDGESLCFGGVAEEPGAIQNNMLSVQRGNSYCFSSPGVAGSAGYVLMARIEIVAANADTPITFVFSQRGARTPMNVYVSFASVSHLDPVDAWCQYEGTNYGAFLCRVSPSIWELYVQKVSTYDTITLQEWFTSKTMGSRISITFPGTLADALPASWIRATPAKLRNILDYIYPVGSIVIRYDHHLPSDLFGGTWVRISNAFLWAVDSSGSIGLTGGAKEVTLTTAQLPSHSHGSVYSQHAENANGKILAWLSSPAGSNLAYGPVATGGGQPHNNMPPYIQVSVWRRTA